jgi:hypothetical protein
MNTKPCWGHARLAPPLYVHVLDTETTGFPGEDPDAHVVEIAFVTYLLSKGRAIKVDHDAWFVRPPVLEARHLEICGRVSGITREDIDSGISAELSARRLSGYVWRKPGPITAWNMPFDRRMVRRTLFGLREEEIHDFGADLKYGSPIELPMADGVTWGGCAARHYLDVKGPIAGHFDAGEGRPSPRVPSLALACIAEAIERDKDNAHRALWDAEVTGLLVKQLWEKGVQRWGA